MRSDESTGVYHCSRGWHCVHSSLQGVYTLGPSSACRWGGQLCIAAARSRVSSISLPQIMFGFETTDSGCKVSRYMGTCVCTELSDPPRSHFCKLCCLLGTQKPRKPPYPSSLSLSDTHKPCPPSSPLPRHGAGADITGAGPAPLTSNTSRGRAHGLHAAPDAVLPHVQRHGPRPAHLLRLPGAQVTTSL